ncbi:MAG: hypothetical protein Q9225_002712 [Loekoesia sp. 1 TL-2023]
MDEELANILLPVFRDTSLEDEDRYDQAWTLLKEVSSRKGQALEEQRKRVFLRCREIIKAETTAAAEERRRQAAATELPEGNPTPVDRTISGQSTSKAAQLLTATDANLEKGGSSQQPSGSAQRPISTLNPRVGEFVPGRPLPQSKEEKRAAYEHRMESLRAKMAAKNEEIKQLQGQIKWHNEEMQKLQISQNEPLGRYLTLLEASTESPMSSDEGRRLLSEGQAAEDKTKELKEARSSLMREKLKAQEELEELHEDMMPREGELGPEQ